GDIGVQKVLAFADGSTGEALTPRKIGRTETAVAIVDARPWDCKRSSHRAARLHRKRFKSEQNRASKKIFRIWIAIHHASDQTVKHLFPRRWLSAGRLIPMADSGLPTLAKPTFPLRRPGRSLLRGRQGFRHLELELLESRL